MKKLVLILFLCGSALGQSLQTQSGTKRLVAGTNIVLTADGDSVSIAGPAGSGEANTGSNLGGGVANYSTKVGVDLRFNSFPAYYYTLTSNLIYPDTTHLQTVAGLAAWAGSANVTTLGTITTGIWNAGAVTSTGNIAANGGSLTTSQTTGNLFNTTVTTGNLFGAATTLTIGATGTTTLSVGDTKTLSLAADSTITNAGLTDVMTFTVGANQGYHVELEYACSGNNTTGDVAQDLVASTATYTVAANFTQGVIYGATGTLTTRAATAFSSTTSAQGTLTVNNGDGVIRNVHMFYDFTCSAGATIKLQVGNASASAGRTSTIYAKAKMIITRIR